MYIQVTFPKELHDHLPFPCPFHISRDAKVTPATLLSLKIAIASYVKERGLPLPLISGVKRSPWELQIVTKKHPERRPFTLEDFVKIKKEHDAKTPAGKPEKTLTLMLGFSPLIELFDRCLKIPLPSAICPNPVLETIPSHQGELLLRFPLNHSLFTFHPSLVDQALIMVASDDNSLSHVGALIEGLVSRTPPDAEALRRAQRFLKAAAKASTEPRYQQAARANIQYFLKLLFNCHEDPRAAVVPELAPDLRALAAARAAVVPELAPHLRGNHVNTLQLEDINQHEFDHLIPLFTNLTALNLAFSSEVRDLSPLAALTQLTTLEIDGGKETNEVLNLDFLAPLTQLTKLTLTDFSPTFNDASVIASFKNLVSLEIDDHALSLIQTKTPLSQVKFLKVYCTEVPTEEMLSSLIGLFPNLTKLSFDSLIQANLTPLASLIHLETLSLNFCIEPDGFSSLGSLPHLREIVLQEDADRESVAEDVRLALPRITTRRG